MPNRLLDHSPILLSRRWRFAFAAVALLLVINGLTSYRAMRELVRIESSVSHTLQVIGIIRNTFSAIQGAETGQRGYLITGDEAYLEPFHDAMNSLEIYLNQLQATDSEIPGQQERFLRLRQVTQSKISEMREVIQLRKNSDVAAATEIVNTDKGKRLMDIISKLVEEMEAEEYALLAQRRHESYLNQRETIFTLVAATLASLGLIGFVYYLLQRNLLQHTRITEILRTENDLLEEKVSERTAVLTHFSKELERSNRELQDFAFVASHDLQEPLRKIRAFGDRLQQKYADKLEDSGADYIRRMQSAAERMSRLINDLLSFSRVSTKAQPFTQVDLNEILDEVLDDLEIPINESGAEIKASSLPTLDADPTQMRQLMQNLIGNSLKFIPPDQKPLITISVKSYQHSLLEGGEETEWCELRFTDNGIGFDEKFKDRIFTPFQRLHQRGEYEGTGIGLAVCRRIVERHSGAINAESIPGEGATFIVNLPLQHTPISEMEPEQYA
ncbi:CHASE3 domain-containing protein [Hahella sp. KA22]|uniref:sensor histidine kinase n=1 Tax=Hahella sp. KA22 TaxID=1628392 RepID=UPI0013E37885|nr:sensor histidine kinase [Hahella sp. KA22]